MPSSPPADVRPDDLAATAIRALVQRARLPPDQIDDVILGCANQAGEDNRNVARMAALLAGLPVGVPGQTVNRLCGSGLQAVASAAQTIRVGEGDLLVAGGVESMTRAPQVMLKSGRAWDRSPPVMADSTVGWRFVNPRMSPEWTISLGETAERIGSLYGISRREQDEFALDSQRKALAALEAGIFDQELVEVEVPTPSGPVAVCRDEAPRPGLSLEKLAQLKPAFVPEGTVTAGSSSGINDGAAALSLVSSAALDRLELTPVHALKRTGGRYGLATMCIGVGQGIALVIESAG